jgi:hypothetical protein
VIAAFSTGGNFAHGDLTELFASGLSGCVGFSGKLFNIRPGLVGARILAPGRSIVLPVVIVLKRASAVGGSLSGSSTLVLACDASANNGILLVLDCSAGTLAAGFEASAYSIGSGSHEMSSSSSSAHLDVVAPATSAPRRDAS